MTRGRTRRTGILTAVLTAALAPGCQRSPVGAGQIVTIDGDLKLADGSPAQGAKVGLYDGDLVDFLLFAFLPAFLPVSETHADGGGRYVLTLDGALANGIFGARTFTMGVGSRVNRNPDWPDATVSFKVFQPNVTVPTLQLWEGNGQVALTAGQAHFLFDDLQTRTGVTADRYEVELELQGVVLEHLVAGTSPSASFPRLALQDATWKWRPCAYQRESGSGTRFDRAWRGAAQVVQGVNPPPPTRGAAVTLTPAGAPASAITDGAIIDRTVYDAIAQGTPAPARIEIDLGGTRSLSAVYLYGFGFDGASDFTIALAQAPQQPGTIVGQGHEGGAIVEVPLTPGVVGRYLVIETTGRFTSVAEVAAY